MKKKIKITVDISMFLLFLYLLSYRPGMGLLNHALVGIAQLMLFVVHHVLNLSWYKSLFKGKYGFRRIMLTASDFLLLIAMLFLMVSSLMISGMVFEFVTIQMTGIWRRIHVTSSAWCFVLMAFHVGMHMRGMFLRAERFLAKKNLKWLGIILEAAIFAAGVYCFIQSRLAPKLIMARRIPQIFYSDTALFAIYLLICMGMSVLANWVLQLPSRNRRKRNL